MEATTNAISVKYDFDVVRWFIIMSIVMAVAGTFFGVWIASELAFPFMNFDIQEITFGRLRPVHTNTVIFGFGGNVLMAAGYYTVQRTGSTNLWSNKMAWFTFWGWQLVLLCMWITYPQGITQSKEYAEAEWWVDILLGIVWLAFSLNFMMTVAKRKTSHIYVSNWFFMSMMVMITYLHVINNLVIPVNWTTSYSIYSGVQDAMIQWWWGHNAVGFYLTAGFLGIMYYFVPKQAGRPIFSYRLSVLHFWTLSFGYVWLGAHHLQYTALPDWTGSVGAGISLAMIIPSWGGAMNGMMTLSGAWDRLRTDYVLRFLVVALAFYAMSTFDGPVMAIKSVNALSHFTDWTVGHVHAGALGWMGMISFGALYHMICKLWKTEMYSTSLVGVHFWLSLIGAVTYVVALWISAITQGLMWRAYDDFGTLQYTFVESVSAMHPYMVMRMIGGMLYNLGTWVMLFNVVMTIRQANTLRATRPATANA